MNKALPTIILALLLLPLVASWGIEPARQRADITTDQQYLSVTIENSQHAEGYFKIGFSGALAQYARYTGPVIYLSASDQRYVIPFTLALPEELEPGKQELEIIIEQIPGGASEATVSSLISLKAVVIVDVPLEGNHISAQVTVGSGEADKPTPFTVSILNKGEQAVTVWADISIKGPTNQELALLNTQKAVIPYQGNGKVTASWEGAKEPGLYHADIIVHHDDKTVVLRENFIVGKKEVVAESISADSFRLGAINALSIGLRNKWNQQIEDIYAEVYVLTAQGSILQTFKTAGESIPAYGTIALQAYWDTAKLVVGEYQLNVITNYEGGQTQESFPVVVKMDALEVGGKATGEVIKGEGFIEQNSLLIVLITVLIITNVIIIAYFRRMKKK